MYDEYDELVKRLKIAAQWADKGLLITPSLCLEAADAIEELATNYDAATDIMKHQTEYIEELEANKPRWIPVTERLPDTMKDKSAYSGWSAEIAPSDDVLCYLGSEKRQTVAWYSHTYGEWTTVDENTVYKYGEITHWRPLSKPPKEA